MKIVTIALLAVSFLAAPLLASCQNTRAGLQQDAGRMGQKTQQIGEILTTP